MLGIEDFFLKSIMTSSYFLSTSPVNKLDLLLPAFTEKVRASIQLYKKSHPTHGIILEESYRSNTLQEIYFERGTSKIKKDGMHHFGIACDCMFFIDGKRTYKGDIMLLRQIHEFIGLTVLGMWDPLHVQYIAENEQESLRTEVANRIRSFQQQYGLPVNGDPDLATRKKAIQVFGNSQ